MLISLWDLKSQQSCVVKEYGITLCAEYQTRLMDLGFQPGTIVECVQAPHFGAPKLFKVNNTIYALDHQIAQEVLCE